MWPDVVLRCCRTSRTSERSSVRRRRVSSSERDVSVAAPLRPAETSPSPSPDTTTQRSPAWTRLPPSPSSLCPLCLTATLPSPCFPPTPKSSPWRRWRGSKRRRRRRPRPSTRCWTCGQRASRRSPTSRSRPPTCPQPWRWTEDTDGPRRTGRYDPELILWDTTGRRQMGACPCLLHPEHHTGPLTKVNMDFTMLKEHVIDCCPFTKKSKSLQLR